MNSPTQINCVQNGLITGLDSQVLFARSGRVSRCLRFPFAGLSAGRTFMNAELRSKWVGGIYGQAWKDSTKLEEFIRPGMDTPCIIWLKGKKGSGYGMLLPYVGMRQVLAHRFAYEQAFGLIPHGLHACHKCDNRACVSQYHLFLGTQLDNMRDMYSKKRNGYTGHRGERHWKATVTVPQVLDIRKRFSEGEPLEEIAATVPTSRQAAWFIVTRKTWKHV